ncbi:glycine cleavage system aminomethyltransferase GcvT [Aquibacillus halophilus]|uniref:Aminomethyltransferase n=1 Tax=Aquibacillus halophilus TaxID=930132 RepID=A0A6A8DBP8_9BACI|nr:glycine cleavage system aminomethyltransferase GcvT [Aquibacillus halophilus]MRH43145.1 glycine cleavage system aminomethyltransferase GcvT [Aquibacillus halophilus]
MSELKRTPLYPEYKKLGAKTIDFGGWDMPVQFSSIKQEHYATREYLGLFDVSHMGEILVQGEASESFLQSVLTNDIAKLTPKKAQYTMMCYENGGTVDDLIVYMLEENKYLLVVNASNIEKDFEWLLKHQINGVSITNCSEDFVQLAIQGPKAEQVLQTISNIDLSQIKFFGFESPVRFDGIDANAIVARTGYTGEDGFEVYVPSEVGRQLWTSLISAGEEAGIQPVGLGARDTLRFEATLALYGQELSESISPIEAGLGFAVKTEKDSDFIGKNVLKQQKENGTERKLVGIEMIDKGIPRSGYEVFLGEEQVGFVTTGTQSPTLEKNIGLALIRTEAAKLGTKLYVQVRKRRLKAEVVSTPFYKRSK